MTLRNHIGIHVPSHAGVGADHLPSLRQVSVAFPLNLYPSSQETLQEERKDNFPKGSAHVR